MVRVFIFLTMSVFIFFTMLQDLINSPTVCTVLALESWNYSSAEQGLKDQHVYNIVQCK